MSLEDIKTQGRRAIARLASLSADLIDEDHPEGLVFSDSYAGSGLMIRFHNKRNLTGGLDGDYSQIIDSIEKLVFSDENVAEVSAALVENGQEPLVLSRNARIEVRAVKGSVFILDSEEPADGPIETIWVTAREWA